MIYFFTVTLLVLAISNLSSISKFNINKDKSFSLGYKSKRAVKSKKNWIYAQQITSYIHLFFFAISVIYLIILKYFTNQLYLSINKINLHQFSNLHFFLISNLSILPMILFIFSLVIGAVITENNLKKREKFEYR